MTSRKEDKRVCTNKQFSLLVKPASADCNLRCEYCFYLEKSALYPNFGTHRMPPEVLERMISSFMSTDQAHYAIGWQGGEPTLMGLDFFRSVIALEEQHARRGSIVSNGVQTNATLIDDELASFFAAHRFLLGVSIDGPRELHDQFRHWADGSGTHSDVIEGIECLMRHKVEFNALVLVSSANVGHAREVYNYLCDLGIYYHQYIPCVEFDDQGNPLPYSITGEQWGAFLCEIFDEWVGKDVRRVSVRDFDSILGFMVEQRYSTCTMSGSCSNYLVIEHNGDVYPCDFFVEPDKRLGNILTDDFRSIQESQAYRDFAGMKSRWNDACRSCPYLVFCSGDCPKNRFRHGRNPSDLSWLCSGWKEFYANSIQEFERLALSVINSGRAPRQPGVPRLLESVPYPSPSRNDPCFCGSGKKYKRCHGAHNRTV